MNKNPIIETKFIDIDHDSNPVGEIRNFSNDINSHWSRMIYLSENQELLLTPNMRNDIYIYKGELLENGKEYWIGTFLIRSIDTNLYSGNSGAILFVYSDVFKGTLHETIGPEERKWHRGSAVGMEIAPLINIGHQLSLISWMPGTSISNHEHPFGEEIFVIKWELQDARGKYPAWTWQRFHPNSHHTPFVDVETLILLRNGHLRC